MNTDQHLTTDRPKSGTPHAATPQGSGPPVTLRPVRISDAARLSQVMAAANLDTPPAQWLIPDRHARNDLLLRFFRGLLDLTLRDPAAVVDVTDDLTGYALWLDLDTYDFEPHPDQDMLFNARCGLFADRFRLLDTVCRYSLARSGFHRSWWLAHLGVHPARQGTGIGSALLRHRQDDIDAHMGPPTWTVAVSPRHRAFLERHGFTVHKPESLPDCGPPVWPMLRRPPDGRAEPLGTPR